MKLILALLLNAALAWLFWRWLRGQLRTPRLGRWLPPVLGLKMLAWALASWQLSADARYMQQLADGMTAQLWHDPAAWAQFLPSDEFHYQRWQVVYHGYSNTFFMCKVLSVLNLASLGSFWAGGLYLSLFCLMMCWQLVRTLAETFPETPAGAALVGFMLWPTVVYWSAGVTKESLVLGSAAGLVALLLGWLYGARPATAWRIISCALLVLLHFKMRYFFAGLLFSALGGLAVVRIVQVLSGLRRRWVMVVLFAATIGAGVWVGSEVSQVFRLNRITAQLLRNYTVLTAKSGLRPRIVFKHFSPTVESAARNAPQAAWETLSRPWVWENGLLYKAAGFENLLLLAILAGALAAAGRGRAGHLPFVLGLAFLCYCLSLAVLLGLSTPNLGTLNRYRAVLLPFVLWLALQNDYAARAFRRLGLGNE